SRYAEAAGAYRAALNQRPDAAAWWAGLGISLENVGRNQPARRAYSEAVRRGGLGSALSEYVRERLQALE
ncbi:MAG: tetratricopeptide repeat protein, partial [Ectothiorhodospiraceae bacterium]